MKRCAVPRRSRSYSAFGKRANSCSAFSGKTGSTSLGSMFGICKSRSELVATFLSVLELCSDGHIRVSGEKGNYDVSRALTDTEEENGRNQ